MAYSQIKYFGFNDKVGLLSFENDQNGGVKPYSKRLQATMDHEARALISTAYKRTEELLIHHKELLKILAEALLAKETLNYDDVLKLLGPPPHGKKNLVSPVDFENSINNQSKL
jgi:spastic paraplegia protein 7